MLRLNKTCSQSFWPGDIAWHMGWSFMGFPHLSMGASIPVDLSDRGSIVQVLLRNSKVFGARVDESCRDRSPRGCPAWHWMNEGMGLRQMVCNNFALTILGSFHSRYLELLKQLKRRSFTWNATSYVQWRCPMQKHTSFVQASSCKHLLIMPAFLNTHSHRLRLFS